jgi:hypothetical protein
MYVQLFFIEKSLLCFANFYFKVILDVIFISCGRFDEKMFEFIVYYLSYYVMITGGFGFCSM